MWNPDYTYGKTNTEMNFVHLVGSYLLLLSLMHRTMNLKFANAKQAKETYEYRNIKQKLHKTTAAIWFNKTCRERGIKPNYINIKKKNYFASRCCCYWNERWYRKLTVGRLSYMILLSHDKGFSLVIPQHLWSCCFSSCSYVLSEFNNVGSVDSLLGTTVCDLLALTPNV
jgi:hypothetical protein